MRTKYLLAALLAIMVSLSSCDKGFENINRNPYLFTKMDGVYLLVNAEEMATDQHHYEAEICQQLQLIIGGQEEGGNRNTRNDNFMSTRFTSGYQNIAVLVSAIKDLEGNTERSNLYNMCRIMKAYHAMILVDTYGDVPYSEAGKANIAGINLPKYDDQEEIYADIQSELINATNSLDATKDQVKGEMFYTGNIAKWKRFGNSLLLRLGMRYSKINPSKAKEIVLIATDPARGGVITSNDDNVIIKYNGSQQNPGNGFATVSTRHNWHAGKPYVDFLFQNNDPRMPLSICTYANPKDGIGMNSTPAAQIGCPYGYDENTIVNAPGYPGTVSAGVFKYAQFNRSTIGRVDAWSYLVTAAQTNLLLSEATVRGWINTGTTAQQYYEAGIKAHMKQADMWSTTRGGASPITDAQINTYLAQPNIAFNNARALEQINLQYWVSSFLIWHEAVMNFRRSGYPVLSPIHYPGEDASVTAGDGFIHRMCYPIREWSANQANTQAAANNIGGDQLGTRVFWDIQ